MKVMFMITDVQMNLESLLQIQDSVKMLAFMNKDAFKKHNKKALN